MGIYLFTAHRTTPTMIRTSKTDNSGIMISFKSLTKLNFPRQIQHYKRMICNDSKLHILTSIKIT